MHTIVVMPITWILITQWRLSTMMGKKPSKTIILLQLNTLYLFHFRVENARLYKKNTYALVTWDEAFITEYRRSVTGCGSQRSHVARYSMKNYINSVIFILKLNFNEDHFNVYVSHRSQIQLPDEDHAVYISLYKFALSNNYMPSLRTTTCGHTFSSK